MVVSDPDGSGQIIATSDDLTPNGGLVREVHLISGKSRLVKYYNLARWLMMVVNQPVFLFFFFGGGR